MILISVDLPAPFSPIKAWILPASRVKSTFSSATTPGKRLSMPLSSSAGTFPSMAAASLGWRKSTDIGSVPDDVEIGGQDDDDARHHHLQILVQAENDDAVVDHLQHQHAEQGAEQ